MSRAPAVRAGPAQDTLAFTESLKPGAVRARMSRETRDAYDTQPRTGWFPIAMDVQLLQAMVDVFGRHGMRDVVRRSLSRHLESPLLSTAVHGAVRVFGATPAALLGLFPRFFPSVYRDFGAVRFEKLGPNAVRLIFEDVATEVFQEGLYVLTFEGIVHGVLDLLETPGTVVSKSNVAGRSVVMEATWGPRAVKAGG